ncbi:uncharacterized protein M6B38_205245 [Iris pallida]|uniref:BHLH domain-containing protein n=1 Tax=Iris pallida TaxID=29817 RepID=A0AAX6E7J4_IRIPA|nr:uncharacterized protein M6B38_205245 [Iris pallida]
MQSCGSNGTSSKVDRKTVEKNRRIHMKTLCFKLGSLIPKEDKTTKDAISQHDHLDQAACYIKKLKARIEKLKQRKRLVAHGGGKPPGNDKEPAAADRELEAADGLAGLPVVEVRLREPILEVVLITGPAKRFLFYRVIAVLAEEGVQVVNASFSVVNDKVFYTVHSQLVSSGLAAASRVSERLKEVLMSQQ